MFSLNQLNPIHKLFLILTAFCLSNCSENSEYGDASDYEKGGYSPSSSDNSLGSGIIKGTVLDNASESLSGVRNTTFIDKESAAKIFEKQFGENILDYIQRNPLPMSCVVNLNRTGNFELDIMPIVTSIESFPGIDNIDHQGKLIQRIEAFHSRFTKIFSVISFGIILITINIILNTIKLTIYAKKDLVQDLHIIGIKKIVLLLDLNPMMKSKLVCLLKMFKKLYQKL